MGNGLQGLRAQRSCPILQQRRNMGEDQFEVCDLIVDGVEAPWESFAERTKVGYGGAGAGGETCHSDDCGGNGHRVHGRNSLPNRGRLFAVVR